MTRAQESQERKIELRKTLGLFDATAINVGAIIGAGIFVVTGIVANVAGSALIISILIAGIISLFTALSFAELTAWQPVEGSIYEYGRQLVSPFSGFLAGWMWILSNTFSGAAVSLGFAYYLTAAFPSLPSNIVAAALCIAFTALNFIGVRQSALLNSVLVTIKVAVLAFFIVLGVFYVDALNFSSFAPFNVGVLYGAFFIFFAYGGFARAAVVSEEVKDAKQNIPKATIISLAISTVIYLLVGVVAVGLVRADVLASSNSPLITAIDATGNPYATQIVLVGGLVATASVLLTSILGVSRMAYSMARRRDIPQVLAKLHPRCNTPYYAIWILGALMTLLVLFVDIARVVAISTFSLVFYYSIANLAALKLKPEQRRYPKFVSVVGLSTCLAMLVFVFFAATQAWIAGIVGLTFGTVYYILKNRFKTKAARRQKNA